MNLPEALYFLDTNTRVQCPEITAQQAAELAELLRFLDRSTATRERDDFRARASLAEALSAQLMKERDEARAEVERLKAEVAYLEQYYPRTRAVSDTPVDASDYERPMKFLGIRRCSMCGFESQRDDSDRGRCKHCNGF